MRRACEVGEVPGCETGPAGRLVFVVREIRAALRRPKDNARSAT